MSFIPAIEVASDCLPRKAATDLGHLPGPKGSWYFGNLRDLLPDPTPYLLQMRAHHGDCFTVGQLFNRRVVVLLGMQANRTVLLDPADNFSSRWGWEVMMDFFGRNLLLRDFEDHRVHRRLLTGLFKPPARPLSQRHESDDPRRDGRRRRPTGCVSVCQTARLGHWP